MAAAVRTQNVDDIIPCLRCPDCHQSNFQLDDRKSEWRLGFPLSRESLYCLPCDTEFPLSEEGIPILWSEGIKRYLLGAVSTDTVSANIEVYDATSDHYLLYVRKSDEPKERFLACINSVENDIDAGWHVDIGCGPGHVLAWSSQWAEKHGTKQIGLDVSIQNLRNVLATTNAYAVLGDATALPFRDGSASLVTEASVLHHVEDWKTMVSEASRIAKQERAAIIFDNEPTKKSLAWGRLALMLFESRFVVYKLLSYVSPRWMSFRDMKLAKLNYYGAEVHNQPGRGFDPEEVLDAFSSAGRKCTIYLQAGHELASGTGHNSLQSNILLLLSGLNPSDPECGVLTMVAR